MTRNIFPFYVLIAVDGNFVRLETPPDDSKNFCVGRHFAKRKRKKDERRQRHFIVRPFCDATGFSYDVCPVDVRTIKPSTLYSPTLWHLTCVRIIKHREVPPKLATSKSSQQINVETNKKVEASENLLAGTWASPAGLLTHINCAVTEIDVIRGGTRGPGKKKKKSPESYDSFAKWL